MIRTYNGTMSFFKDIEHLKSIQRAKLERETQNVKKYLTKFKTSPRAELQQN